MGFSVLRFSSKYLTLLAIQFGLAKEAYERVLAENPNHAKVLQQLGWLYHQSNAGFNDQERAIQFLTKSLESDPNDSQSWYLLGRAYMAGQNYNKAYEAYQQAVYRDGKNPTFWCSIGVLYYQINQYRDALDAYSRAIRLNPYISEVWFDLGSLYESCNNQISDAIDAYARAAELDPDNPHIQQRLLLLRNAEAKGEEVSSVPVPQDVHPTAYYNQQGGPPSMISQGRPSSSYIANAGPQLAAAGNGNYDDQPHELPGPGNLPQGGSPPHPRDPRFRDGPGIPRLDDRGFGRPPGPPGALEREREYEHHQGANSPPGRFDPRRQAGDSPPMRRGYEPYGPPGSYRPSWDRERERDFMYERERELAERERAQFGGRGMPPIVDDRRLSGYEGYGNGRGGLPYRDQREGGYGPPDYDGRYARPSGGPHPDARYAGPPGGPPGAAPFEPALERGGPLRRSDDSAPGEAAEEKEVGPSAAAPPAKADPKKRARKSKGEVAANSPAGAKKRKGGVASMAGSPDASPPSTATGPPPAAPKSKRKTAAEKRKEAAAAAAASAAAAATAPPSTAGGISTRAASPAGSDDSSASSKPLASSTNVSRPFVSRVIDEDYDDGAADALLGLAGAASAAAPAMASVPAPAVAKQTPPEASEATMESETAAPSTAAPTEEVKPDLAEAEKEEASTSAPARAASPEGASNGKRPHDGDDSQIQEQAREKRQRTSPPVADPAEAEGNAAAEVNAPTNGDVSMEVASRASPEEEESGERKGDHEREDAAMEDASAQKEAEKQETEDVQEAGEVKDDTTSQAVKAPEEDSVVPEKAEKEASEIDAPAPEQAEAGAVAETQPAAPVPEKTSGEAAGASQEEAKEPASAPQDAEASATAHSEAEEGEVEGEGEKSASAAEKDAADAKGAAPSVEKVEEPTTADKQGSPQAAEGNSKEKAD